MKIKIVSFFYKISSVHICIELFLTMCVCVRVIGCDFQILDLFAIFVYITVELCFFFSKR